MTGQRLIHILTEQVASQIAAGEVVERPASALKELVENSLDAGARTVNAAIERGGAAALIVTDDGCGMSREDAILALRRHATSKIRDAGDLMAIHTLGFRGEALAAIASVSRMVLRTRRPEDELGIEIVAAGGEIERTGGCAMAPGTRIEVRDLFFNTPARLKFLKSVVTEQAAAAGAIQRIALANPRVAFGFEGDGRELIAAPRAATARERWRQLFGPKLAERLLEFEYRSAYGRATGLVATSQESFATPRMVFTFVNGRVVRDRLLARAIAQAYQTLIPRGRHPAVALFVELGAEEVDVNVHPMKTEVRFRRPGALFEMVYHALRARLADQTVAAEHEAIVRANLEQTATADGGMARMAAPGERALRLVADNPAVRVEQRPLGIGYGSTAAAIGFAGGGPAAPAAGDSPMPDGPLAPATHPAWVAPVPRYAQLRVLGQIFAGYIALEDEDGLLLVDQHAAHERVTFERLSAELRAGGVRSQALLVPATLELAPARAATVMAGLDELRAIGFELEPFGPATLLVKGVPAVFGAEGGAGLLRDLIEGIGEGGLGRGTNAFEDLLKRLACHGSVRVGRVLAPGEIAALLADLDATPFKSNCPHGRPVHVRFARGQIERLFRR